MLKNIIGLIFLVLVIKAPAQIKKEIYVDGVLYKELSFGDTLSLHSFLSETLMGMWEKGYLFAVVDSLSDSSVYLFRGEKLKNKGQDVSIIQDGDTILVSNSKTQADRVFNRFAQDGFPFVKMKLDSISIKRGGYHLYYIVDPGPKIVYDSIVLLSAVSINKTYLEDALEIEKEKPFSEKSYRQIQEAIERIPFLELKRKPEVAFEQGRAIIYLDLLQENSSSFEGVIGFQPNPSQVDRMSITGFLDLELNNMFKSGIGLNMTWSRFANESQELDLGYAHPYFLSSALFLNVSFHLIKQDTTYVSSTWGLGLGAFVHKTIALQFSYQKQEGGLIQPDQTDVRAGFGNFKTDNYRLVFGHFDFSNPLTFTKTYRFTSEVSLGDKTISPVNSLDSVRVKRNSLILRYKGAFKYQIPVLKRTAIFHDVSALGVINEEILDNELYRLGGLRTMRGFNENFFFVQQYVLSRLEFRQYFEKKSYFMAFYDQMVYFNKKKIDYPIGFGSGLNLHSSEGLFTFAVSLGTSGDIPLDFSGVKVHLGYTTKF